jgi:glycosyltransferase 2 family protein
MRPDLSRLKHLLRHAPALLGLVLLVGAVYVVQREFRHLRIEDIRHALTDIPGHALWFSAGWTLLAYAVLTLYDTLATIYAGHRVAFRRTAFASFCAYTLSHNLGFAAVSGAAVRYRLYSHWGLSPLQIGKVIAFCSLTFGLGGMVLGGAILFQEPGAVPFFGEHLPHWVLYVVGAALWSTVGTYVVVSRRVGTMRLFGSEITLPKWRMAILQVMLATVDVAITATIFYALLPPAPGLTYLRFVGVYLASYAAGLVASLPGGIGVFDTAMLLGLAPYLPPPPIVGAILIFRLYYYVIPLFLAGGMFAGNEVILRARARFRRRWRVAAREHIASGGSVPITVMRWSEPDFAVAASTGAVALCGALLLTIGVLAPRPDFAWIDPDFADIAASAGQYVPSLIGTALMLLAIALSRRVTLAWGATIVLLLAAAAFTASQAAPLWVPGVLILATLFVAPFRSAYYRHARLLTDPLEASTLLPLLALIGCVLMLGALRKHVRGLAADSWWAVVLSPDMPNALRIALLLAVFLALAAAWRLLRPARVTWLPWRGDGRLRYAALGADPPAQADGLVLGEGGRAGIPFRRLGRLMLALGDPAGAESDRVSAIWRLRDLAHQEGLDLAFWHAGAELLPVYADLGLTALPLGRDGLPASDLPRSGPRPQHYLCCVSQRDFDVLLPQLSAIAAGRRLQEAAE